MEVGLPFPPLYNPLKESRVINLPLTSQEEWMKIAAIAILHLIHFILSCELSLLPRDGHNAPLNLPPEQNLLGP